MLMIKSQKLYEAYDSIEGDKLLERMGEMDSVYHQLQESTKLLTESNKIAFFLIHFLKDFEQKLVYNQNLKKSNVLEIIKKMHSEYSCGIHNFNVEEYQKIIAENTRMIKNHEAKDNLRDLKVKLDNLHCEFQNHRNMENDGLRDLSTITGKDNSIVNTSISVNMTGNTSVPEDKNFVFSSNPQLTGLGEMLLDTDYIMHTESMEDTSPALSGRSLLRTSYSQLQSKVGIFEKNIASLLKSEAKLKGVINRLRSERDSYKDLLQKQKGFKELQQSITSINSAILAHQSIGELKFNHQIMLKNLIDDDLRKRLKIKESI